MATLASAAAVLMLCAANWQEIRYWGMQTLQVRICERPRLR
ncbi:putative membrane protein [Sinorhizobium fredii]